MTGYTPPIRLFVDAEVTTGTTVTLDKEQAHYLGHVMRRSAGDRVEIFNGRTDSMVAEITEIGRKSASLQVMRTCNFFQQSPDIWFLFAPVKRTRLDFMAQKATELGARKIQPVDTEFCQVSRVNLDRLSANAIEAAEQTGRLDIPEIGPFASLSAVLADWPSDRHLLFCDEALAGDTGFNPVQQLSATPLQKAGLLIGPEGGFSDAERQMIKQIPLLRPLSLGPRILRSDTAALAALSLFQAVCGDWSVFEVNK